MADSDTSPVPGLVSTIIPVYNRGALFLEAVDSVLAQTWRPIEIVIVDDGSSDDTLAVARRLEEEQLGVVRVLHQANAGPGPARQAGLAIARGEFIQFLDSDDLLLPDKFARQVDGLRSDPEAGISYGLSLVRDEGSGETRVTHGTDTAHREIFPAVLRQRLWPTIAPLYRREVCSAIGPWAATRVLEDWDYDCRAGLLGVKLHYCPEPVVVKRHEMGDHAGLAWQHDPRAMRDRAQAYMAVFGHARRAGLAMDSAEMRQLVRSLFWMARSLAARGFEDESRQLFSLARDNAVEGHFEYRAYAALAQLLGWQRTARWAQRLRQQA